MSGDARVSQKGTKTRARQATHGRALVSSLRCPRPECQCRQVIRTQASNAPAAYLCCGCGQFFDLPNG